VAGKDFWDPLTEKEKHNVAQWIGIYFYHTYARSCNPDALTMLKAA